MVEMRRTVPLLLAWVQLAAPGCASMEADLAAEGERAGTEAGGMAPELGPRRPRRREPSEPAPPALRAAHIAAVQAEAPEAYNVTAAAGGMRARNPRQRLDVDLTADGVRLEHEGWSFSLAAARYGCAGTLHPVAPAAPRGERNRVEYLRDGAAGARMVEWYVNGPLGVEQGFTLPAAPACGDGGRPDEVVIELAVSGAVAAQPGDGGWAVALHEPDGARVARYGELFVRDAAGRELPARLEVQGGGAVAIRVEARGAMYPVVVDPLIWMQQAKLLPTDGMANGRFGFSATLSGDTALVGAIYDDDQGEASGSVHVFVHSGGAWSHQAKLLPTDGEAGDEFGTSVALSGDTALIGAASDDDQGDNSGSAYVFVRSGGAWSQQAKLLPNDGEATDSFGNSIGVSGDTALVGARGDDDQGDSSGSAYVFVRSGGAWSQQTKLLPNDGEAIDFFGNSVGVSGDTALVGAYYDGDQGLASGSAYVFVRSGGAWSQQAKLLPNDGAETDFFGTSVTLSGETALVGAKGDDDQGDSSGSAYVFVRSGGAWSQQAKLLPNDGEAADVFGTSVALSGETALVGAHGDDDQGTDSGSAYLFVRSGGAWSQLAKLLPNDLVVDDLFGTSVALSGETALVVALADDDQGTDSGSAYVFGLNLDLGSPCASVIECASGSCIDGVCCDAACVGTCEACSIAAGAPANGVCAPLTGPACDDSDSCTLTDICQAGVCVGSIPIQDDTDGDSQADTCDTDDDEDGIPDPIDNCPQQSNPTQADANQDGIGDDCDCSTPPKPNGEPCYDGELCTQDDTCQSGVCVSGPPVTCPDLGVCLVGQCDSASGACVSLYKLEGTPCVEGGESGTCIAGGCFIEQPNGVGGGSSTGSGSPAGAGGAGGGSGGNDPVGSGAGAGAPSGATPGSERFLRLHGNGCTTSGAGSEGGGAFGLLFALLLAARRARGPVAPTARANSRRR